MSQYKVLVSIGGLAILCGVAWSRPALALLPGDCGKPLKSATPDASAPPLATDALVIFRAAVGLVVCTDHVCDVNSSGGNGASDDGVTVTDALTVLRAAVGLPETLTCPPCAPDECICTKTDLFTLLDSESDPNFTMLTPDVAALLDCDLPTTLKVTEKEWNTKDPNMNQARRRIHRSDAWFHGKNITIQLYPLCDNNDCSTVPDNGINFLTFVGDNLGVSGITVRRFFDGVHFAGKNGTVANMVFKQMCDDAITNESTGLGSEVRDSLIKKGCDKCVQDEAGPPIDAGCSDRECYHNAYYNVDFDGCATPIRFSNTASYGKFLVHGGTHRPIAGWPCNGSKVGALGLEVTVEGITVDGCGTGFVFGNGTHVLQGNSHIINGSDRGVVSSKSAHLTVKDTEIRNNGGAIPSTPYGGGAVAIDTSMPDLGSATNPGQNCIFDNSARPNADPEVGREVANHVPGLALPAQHNWWNGTPELFIAKVCSNNPQQTCTADAQCDGGTCIPGTGSIDTSDPLSAAPAFCQ